MANKGLYIHIPFCVRKCNYCDFCSVAMTTQVVDNYIAALTKEIKLKSLKYKDAVIDTIYFGGGTPSLLSSTQLSNIIECIRTVFDCQIIEQTIEVNPDSSSIISCLPKLGFNRVSIGIQSLNDKTLDCIGRLHNAQIALDAVNLARDNFENISIDLMLGLPNQSQDDIKFAIDKLSLNVKHISAYILKIEKGTKMFSQLANNEYTIPNDDEVADLYEFTVDYLAKLGFERYEISNFAKKGYESIHNLKYWERKEYIGFGASAHSFVNNIRCCNTNIVSDYIDRGDGNKILEILDLDAELFEDIMLGLRLKVGINITKINKKYNINFLEKYSEVIKKLGSHLIFENNRLFLADKSMLLQSSIVNYFSK